MFISSEFSFLRFKKEQYLFRIREVMGPAKRFKTENNFVATKTLLVRILKLFKGLFNQYFHKSNYFMKTVSPGALNPK